MSDPRLWHLRIEPNSAQPDAKGQALAEEAADLGIPGPWAIAARRGFLIETAESPEALSAAVARALVDPVAEAYSLAPCGASEPSEAPEGASIVHVFPKAGVTDPEGESATAVLRSLGLDVEQARTARTYLIQGPAESVPALAARVLSNDAVEDVAVGPIRFDRLHHGSDYAFRLVTVAIREMTDAQLVQASREGQLALSLDEMRTIQAHFNDLGRDPTDCELETVAQTWSEHCSHKTLRGRIEFEGEIIENLLKTTIFKATQELQSDFLVSVFEDNAGVVRFDDDFDVCFKVETHNHPSAIDPYGGANTGLGGVIRDILGTGLGAKPIANTDVFCVGPPDLPASELPEGVLHPKRVLRGIVAGVRDYGNRMGIPTVNGAVCVDPGYLSNPLVFCGTVGVIPRGMSTKEVRPGDLVVTLGGLTGRDGIHGATFSSIELSGESQDLSGGAVQIGNAITEKKVLDVVLQARDRGLFRAITDCGAGGFSSAVGEMGAEVGAVVELEKAPLKYRGLSYTEIWISEAQERMVLAVPPEHWPALQALARAEDVDATAIGTFGNDGRLKLTYQGNVVADLSMHLLHEGRPRVVRKAEFPAPAAEPVDLPDREDYTEDLVKILGDWDVCSKAWIVRQYDHEVQARTVVKPLAGLDGPGDAAVVLPVLGSSRGLAISCGINPRLGPLDPYSMAGCVIDEAIRNAVAVGADPDRIAILDNFCWGNTERPRTLGALVLAARGCHDYALAYGTPFISGKDSLNNEYTHQGQTLAIPHTLLISAIGQVPDAQRCVTMDLKSAGNSLWIVGQTGDDWGGSLYLGHRGLAGGRVPRPDATAARQSFRAVHQAIARGLVRSCHDLSEGGLAAALAEMAIAGGLGIDASLRDVPCAATAARDLTLLFAETPSRFILEVEPESERALMDLFGELPLGRLGTVKADPALSVGGLDHRPVISAGLDRLTSAWQTPLDW